MTDDCLCRDCVLFPVCERTIRATAKACFCYRRFTVLTEDVEDDEHNGQTVYAVKYYAGCNITMALGLHWVEEDFETGKPIPPMLCGHRVTIYRGLRYFEVGFSRKQLENLIARNPFFIGDKIEKL
ncbi:MAG: hypothetical protein Pg6A_19760 [Termitinemataceae bacterium]|nr:MAG: hypothetical protein Pg6A_19760 [Termitinemataceae bacterium]